MYDQMRRARDRFHLGLTYKVLLPIMALLLVSCSLPAPGGAPPITRNMTDGTVPNRLDQFQEMPAMESGVPDAMGTITDGGQVVPDDQGMSPPPCDDPSPEVCDGEDNDCDAIVDEDVQNRCNTCGPEPEEQCNGLDDDCNGVIDDGCPCSPGATERCGSDVGACETGMRACDDEGSWGPCSHTGPEHESCDALDNDCDGRTDEELVRSCGSNVGLCRVGIEHCLQGLWPGTCEGEIPPVAEMCNLQDDDCDGEVDEEIVPAESTCGVGTCRNTGQVECQEGRLVDTCMPGAPAVESCDRRDNDCDGQIDEDIAPQPTNCGLGVCAATGQARCQDGRLVDSCSPGPSSPETCDGQDNDCDGRTDEDIAPVQTNCGRGACATTGESLCQNSRLVDTCSPGQSSGETCDGQDNDCDGRTDEDVASENIQCGVGACQAMGLRVCRNGAFANDCTPNPQSPETCDRADNDCDGQSDEGFNVGAACSTGVGACRSNGVRACSANGQGSRCNAVASAPGNEGAACNYVDDDCDGSVDEGIGSAEDWSLPANCDGADNDCDGRIDEGYAQCHIINGGGIVGRIELSCVDGVLVAGCQP